MAAGRTILTRIVYGAIMIAVLAGLLWLDHLDVWPPAGRAPGVVLAGVFAILGVLGFREVGWLAERAGLGVLAVSGTIGAVLLGTTPVWLQVYPLPWTAGFVWVVLGAIVACVFAEQMVRHRTAGAVGHVAGTLLAVLYLGVGAAAMLTIRLDWGIPMLVVFLAGVKFTDIGAYFVGSAVGRHKLIPWLSPGKSWEGLIGGLLAGAGGSVLAAWAFGLSDATATHLPLWQAGVFGLAVGLTGQFGDLCESLLKRSAQVKDSGSAVPEFGGVLDLLDSPLIAAPVAYFLLQTAPR